MTQGYHTIYDDPKSSIHLLIQNQAIIIKFPF